MIKKLKVEESKFPDNEGKYVLFLYSESEKGFSCKRIFKGSKNECLMYKKELLNER